MEQPEQDSPADGQGQSSGLAGLAKTAMTAVVTIVLEAMKEGPAWSRALIALAAIEIILVMFGALSLLAFGEAYLAFWLMAINVVVIVVALLILMGIVAIQANSSQSAGVTGEPAGASKSASRSIPWARAVPRLPISDDQFTELRQELDDIRNAAFAWLNGRHSDIKIAEVRANVFLPDIDKAENGNVGELFMPAQLKVGMKGHADESIRFHPGQGVTGVVFIHQKPRCAYSTKEAREGKSGQEEVYPLTRDQKRQINRDLCWIVSFPLRVPDQGTEMAGGVLNVDGLHHELSRDELTLLMGELALRVAGFAERLAALPKTRVTITLEDI